MGPPTRDPRQNTPAPPFPTPQGNFPPPPGPGGYPPNNQFPPPGSFPPPFNPPPGFMGNPPPGFPGQVPPPGGFPPNQIPINVVQQLEALPTDQLEELLKRTNNPIIDAILKRRFGR